MALTDPLSYVLNTVTYNFDRIAEGTYLQRGTTLDQPSFLNIERTLKPDAVSSYLIKRTEAKNVVVNGVKTDDDVLQVHVVIKCPHRSFTAADCKTAFSHLNSTLFNDVGMFDKLINGQR